MTVTMNKPEPGPGDPAVSSNCITLFLPIALHYVVRSQEYLN